MDTGDGKGGIVEKTNAPSSASAKRILRDVASRS